MNYNFSQLKAIALQKALNFNLLSKSGVQDSAAYVPFPDKDHFRSSTVRDAIKEMGKPVIGTEYVDNGIKRLGRRVENLPDAKLRKLVNKRSGIDNTKMRQAQKEAKRTEIKYRTIKNEVKRLIKSGTSKGNEAELLSRAVTNAEKKMGNKQNLQQ